MTNTSNTKEKLPLDRVYCQFECLQQTEKIDANGKKTQVFKWKPVHSYKLYLFFKKNDQFYRMPDNPAPAEPITTVDDNPEYIIKESDIGKCNYAFKKGVTYYGYFSGRELTQKEINGLMGERSYVLLKIAPSDTGLLRLDSSLFQYLVFLQQFEKGLSGDVALTKINQIYNSKFTDLTSAPEKQLHKNNYTIATNEETIKMSNFFEAWLANKKGKAPVWEKHLAGTVSKTIQFHEDTNSTPTKNLYSFESALHKITTENYHKILLESHTLGVALGNISSTPNKKGGLTEKIEGFFYKSKFSEISKNNIEATYYE